MRAKNWQKPLPWLVVAALLVLWEVCVRAFDVPLYVLPGPIDVIEALFADVGTLFPHALVTLSEAALGMVIALAFGLLLGVGFLPSSWDAPANALVSFTCAMQVQAFRKVNGSAYASTMCIGNLRSGVDAFCAYWDTRDRTALRKAGRYFAVILIFALGAGFGGVASQLWGTGAIWASCLLLAVSFLLMFRQEIQAEADC